MRIGVPKEIKKNEYRVALTPRGVEQFVRSGHDVFIEKNAGKGSGYFDEAYKEAGAIITDAADVYEKAEMIYKVKEILPPEYAYMKENLIIFTYLHSNGNQEMTDVLLNSKVVAISYEDIEDEDGMFPLLKPMSELAGKGGFIAALNFSQSIHSGNGLMLTRVHGVKTPTVAIIGAGRSGLGAAELASAMGNRVVILDIDMDKLEEAKFKLPLNVELLHSSRSNLVETLKEADVMINCILWNKNAKGHLIYRNDLKLMKPGSLIVDVSCDEKGAIETSRPTSHEKPVYEEEGIQHYVVDNIPAAFSRTATQSLCNITLPYALKIANNGVKKALSENEYFRKGLCFYKGKLTLKETAMKFSLEYTDPKDALGIISEDLK
ncbi:alanine dehydrogenase [Metallumcola ferriviriculae]|uniref:alanine dehydrogenase n=1 Tax=Metallumcola ferriviriculae TaxID=3039180 RepID=A0AAU0USH9_9FIRM|nr:alanine dehydrogenase [Desulfitibacteraceae bacterium MK1]